MENTQVVYWFSDIVMTWGNTMVYTLYGSPFQYYTVFTSTLYTTPVNAQKGNEKLCSCNYYPTCSYIHTGLFH